MRDVQPRELQFYRMPNGREPFAEWYNAIQDPWTQSRIQKRLVRLGLGNFGDCRSVGSGVFELRLQFAAGYRIYFGEVDDTVVLILCGGDKSSQTRDITQAKTYWLQYKEIQR